MRVERTSDWPAAGALHGAATGRYSARSDAQRTIVDVCSEIECAGHAGLDRAIDGRRRLPTTYAAQGNLSRAPRAHGAQGAVGAGQLVDLAAPLDVKSTEPRKEFVLEPAGGWEDAVREIATHPVLAHARPGDLTDVGTVLGLHAGAFRGARGAPAVGVVAALQPFLRGDTFFARFTGTLRAFAFLLPDPC